MLPDFLKLKTEISKNISKYLSTLIKQEPFLAHMQHAIHHEGNTMSGISEDGFMDNSGYQTFSAETKADREDIIKNGPIAFIKNIQMVAEEMKKEQAGFVIKKLNEITQATGNIIEGKSQPFSFDLFIQMIEKVLIDFNDNGDPYMPTAFVSTATAIKLKDELPKWDTNPEYKQRMDAVIEKKRNVRHSYPA